MRRNLHRARRKNDVSGGVADAVDAVVGDGEARGHRIEAIAGSAGTTWSKVRSEAVNRWLDSGMAVVMSHPRSAARPGSRDRVLYQGKCGGHPTQQWIS
jgi:hypothetical protein